MKCIEAESDSVDIVDKGPGFVVGSFDEKYLQPIASRISLTRRLGRYLGSYDVNDLSSLSFVKIPAGTFAIKGKRFKGMMKEISSYDVIRKVGKIFSRNNDVDLENPEQEIRLLMSDRLHVYIGDRTIDRNSFEARKVGERPFFSPISLHPRFARAIINLTGIKKGGTILDPFCGTGGIVVEAASMGMKVMASDFDPEMVAGTLENMDYYGMKLCDSEVLDVADIADRFGKVDAVVTDPPYGRSTRISEKNLENIYRAAMNSFYDVLVPGGAAGIIFPYPVEDKRLRRECMFVQRVHRSLSRHYCVFRRDL